MIETTEEYCNETFDYMLLSAYAYYIKDTTICSDELYEMGVRFILQKWEKITLPYKNIVDFEGLKGNPSLFYLREEDYPEEIRDRFNKRFWG